MKNLEFEVARRYVRLAAEATKNVAASAKNPAPPKTIVTQAIKKAAKVHAPGLLSPVRSTTVYGGTSNSPAGINTASGTWQRQNGQIVLFGV